MRNPEISKRLDEAMKETNISAKELSDRSGVPQSSISQYLSGIFAPRNQTAKKLADALGVNPMWLMNFENEPKHRYEEQSFYHLFEHLKKLNAAGIDKLIERADELAELSKYRKESDK